MIRIDTKNTNKITMIDEITIYLFDQCNSRYKYTGGFTVGCYSVDS